MGAQDANDARAPVVAVYPGSFDPVTNGHVDIVERSARIFDRVIVAVGQHPSKRGFFPADERVQLLADSLVHLDNVECTSFRGLVVRFCREQGASVIVRGIRAISDFEAEFQMGQANRQLAPGVETVFLFPEPNEQFISSSLIKEIASHGGAFEQYVPDPVASAMKARYAGSSQKS